MLKNVWFYQVQPNLLTFQDTTILFKIQESESRLLIIMLLLKDGQWQNK